MEGAMLLQKSAIPASTMLLDNCTHAIEQGNFEEALNICIQFLENFPVDNSNRDKNSIGYHNYLRLCSIMMNDNLHYASVINLMNIKQSVIDFAMSFFIEIGKKGIHFPKPVVQKEDVLFVFVFCKQIQQLILEKLQRHPEN